jgi:AraC-like DNA-binding protein
MAVLTNLLQSIRVIATSARRIELRGEAVVQFARDPHLTLHIVLAGRTRVRASEGRFDRRMREDQYLFVPAGVDHQAGGASRRPHALAPVASGERIPLWRIGEGESACTLLTVKVELDQARLEAVARIMPEMRRNIPEGAPTVFELPEMLSASGLAQTTLLAGGEALLHCAVEAMLVSAVRELITSGNAAVLTSPNVQSAPVAAALRMIYNHFDRPWSVASLANEAGMSRSVFAKVFAAQVGNTPMAFLARVRMMHAETLLREDRHTLATIAGLCGYRSETAFNRAFRRCTGVSPGTVRDIMRTNAPRPPPLAKSIVAVAESRYENG